MIQIQRILHPTDFSECARKAGDYAFQLAELFDAELALLHVLPDPATAVPQFGMGLAFPAFSENIPRRMQQMEENAISALNGLIPAGWAAEHRVVVATQQGTPFLETIRYAQSHNVDLIVMGTHGRGAIAHTLLGSVAENVVRKAPCPVLTVRPDGHQFVMP